MLLAQMEVFDFSRVLQQTLWQSPDLYPENSDHILLPSLRLRLNLRLARRQCC